MARPGKYPSELRERAIRLVIEVREDHPSEAAAIRSVAAKLGIASPEQLRTWLRQAEIDGGVRPGRTTEEAAEIKRLKGEHAELRRANEILKAASAFFAVGLDRPAGSDRLRCREQGRVRGRADHSRADRARDHDRPVHLL